MSLRCCWKYISSKHVQVFFSSRQYPPPESESSWYFCLNRQPQTGRSGLWLPAQFPDGKSFCGMLPVEMSEVTQLPGNSVGGWQSVVMFSWSHNMQLCNDWTLKIAALFRYKRNGLQQLFQNHHCFSSLLSFYKDNRGIGLIREDSFHFSPFYIANSQHKTITFWFLCYKQSRKMFSTVW